MNVHHERILIPSRNPGRHLAADIYYHQSHLRSGTSKSPILINWHGSGFIFPLLGSDTLFCAQIARDTGITVLDVDYRKAPETPFPGPLEDAEDALAWVAAQPARFDLSCVAVSGFSAGADLALVIASTLRDAIADVTIQAAIAIYPVTDLSIPPETKTVPKPVKTHPLFLQHLFNDAYAPDKASRLDPRVSPGLADPAGFPDTVAIVTCEGDTFGPEGRALADKLVDGKRKVVNWTLKGVYHGFDKGCREGTWEWKQREVAYGLVVETLKKGDKKDVENQKNGL